MNDAIFNFILATLTLIELAITGTIIPWIKSKLDEQKIKECTIWAEKAVKCARQIYGEGNGEIKKKFVTLYLSKITKGKLAGEQLDILIEAAVKELKLAEQAAISQQNKEAPDE